MTYSEALALVTFLWYFKSEFKSSLAIADPIAIANLRHFPIVRNAQVLSNLKDMNPLSSIVSALYSVMTSPFKIAS